MDGLRMALRKGGVFFLKPASCSPALAATASTSAANYTNYDKNPRAQELHDSKIWHFSALSANKYNYEAQILQQ